MIKKCLIFIIIVSLYSVGFTQGFLRRENQKIVNGSGEEVILRGMGLGGWMLQEGYMMQTSSFANAQFQLKQKIEELVGESNTQAFYDAWLANHCRKIDVDSLAAWGFNCIRLPMHYNLFTLPIEEEPVSGENTWLTKGFELTDELLAWCASNNIYLILDLHAAPGGQGYESGISDYDPSKPSLWESAENRAKTVALWKKIAERYADEPWIGGYDLINETNWNLPGNAMLKQLYLDITSAIREVDNNHIIFIEGNWFANDFTGLTPPWDNNMVYSFHKYWSYNNQSSIQWMLDIRKTYNIPIWCGESGENSNVWFTDAIKLFEDNNIGWAWWPMKKIESISGPLSIKKTDGYQRLLDYWEGNASKPSEQFAVSALMELAENSKLENCIYQKDVIDAMFRQVKENKTLPFKEHQLPGTIQAVDYDLGKQGNAYFDTEVATYHVSSGSFTAWNNGFAYRNDGVDIEKSNDSEGPEYSVGWIDASEWVSYTVNVTKSDSYRVAIRYSSPEGQGILELRANNIIMEQKVLPETGGWYNWETIEFDTIWLETGQTKIEWKCLTPGFNLNELTFSSLSSLGSNGQIPSSPQLNQNYPNPFNGSSLFRFYIYKAGKATVELFNSRGSRVDVLFNRNVTAGFEGEVSVDARNLSSGVYYYRLKSGSSTITKKMVVIR